MLEGLFYWLLLRTEAAVQLSLHGIIIHMKRNPGDISEKQERGQ
jgi:hypothetical protein